MLSKVTFHSNVYLIARECCTQLSKLAEQSFTSYNLRCHSQVMSWSVHVMITDHSGHVMSRLNILSVFKKFNLSRLFYYFTTVKTGSRWFTCRKTRRQIIQYSNSWAAAADLYELWAVSRHETWDKGEENALYSKLWTFPSAWLIHNK